MSSERVDKLLAATGRWSRKEAKAIIAQGRVTLGSVTVTDGGEKCPPDGQVAVDSTPLHQGLTYLMYHKPAGLLSATTDARQKTVLDELPLHMRHIGLFPVGRLDKDTEGLLLLTNDGDLAHRLLSPQKDIGKTYFLRVTGAFTPYDVAQLERGLVLGDGLHCKPAKLVPGTAPNEGELTITEGKFHQVKRMMAALGKPVEYLKRCSMGSLILDDQLPPGGWRPLTNAERSGLGI